jgi:hypothetical protein
MSLRTGALSIVIGLIGTGLFACGTGSGATVGSPGIAASVGSATAAPGVVVTMPAGPVTSPSGGGAKGQGTRPGHRLLTVADDGVTVRLHPGQVVRVVLASGGLRWDIPGATGTAARRISGSGGYPAYRPAVAVFRAERPGRSWLTSFTDAPCLHTQPRCELPQRLWRALIIVPNT